MKKNLLLLFSFVSLVLTAQEKDAKWGVRVDGIGFGKNNEYEKKPLKGYTDIGTLTRASLLWKKDSLTLEVGAIGRIYQGGKQEVFPRVLLKANLTDKWILNLGNIAEKYRHRLPEAFLDTRFLYQHIEEGIQLTYRTETSDFDFWVDWQEHIQPQASKQERFMAGLSYSFLKKLGQQAIRVTPLQVIGYHVGGEIDTLDLPILTQINTRSSLQWKVPVANGAWWTSADFYTFLAKDNNENHPESLQKDKGFGFEVKLRYESETWNSSLAYWHSKDFYSPMGEQIFQRPIEVKGDYELDIIVNQISYKLFGKQVYNLVLMQSNYFDLDTSKFSFYTNLSLTFDLEHWF